MKIHTFKLFVGIRFSENLNDREWKNVYNEIENLSNYYQITYNESVLVEKVKFTFAKSKKDILQVKDSFHFLRTDNILIIEFKSSIKVFQDHKLYFISILEKRFRDLIIGISIAKKGGIDSAEGPILFVNNKLEAKLESSIHSIGFGAEKAHKIKWPKLKILDLRTTLNWLYKYQSQTDSHSTDKIGRALNAYSHLFSNSGEFDDGSSLFWTMLGLEAIYTSETENVMNQVNLKTQVLLGYRKEFKKSIKEMYSYRSSFVHGSLNIPNKLILHEQSERDLKHWNNFYENLNLAIGVLIGTFQKMILKNLTQLDFDFAYKLKISK